jgi:hypothetical protein
MINKEIIVLVWDEPGNFLSSETQRSFGGENVFKELKQFKSIEEFDEKVKEINDKDKLVFCCHVKLSDFSLYEEFKYSGIRDKYNIPEVHFLSSDATRASDKFKKKFGESEKILFYNGFITKILAGEIKTFSKNTIFQKDNTERVRIDTVDSNKNYHKADYALITALEEDEMEKVLPLIEKEGKIDDDKILIEYGHLVANPEKKNSLCFSTFNRND